MTVWNVARGLIVGTNTLRRHSTRLVSFFFANRVKTEKFYDMEKRLDQVRAHKFPQKVSRLHGVFFFETEPTIHVRSTLLFQKCFLAEGLLTNSNPNITRVDMNWLDAYANGHFNNDDWMEKYWAGEECPIWPNNMPCEPIWECITDADIMIPSKELRGKCYQISLSIHKPLVKPLLMLSVWGYSVNGLWGNVSYLYKETDSEKCLMPVIYAPDNDELISILEHVSRVDPNSYKAICYELNKDKEYLFATPIFETYAKILQKDG